MTHTAISAEVEVLVSFLKLRNIDLLEQGLYRVAVSVCWEGDEKRPATPVGLLANNTAGRHGRWQEKALPQFPGAFVHEGPAATKDGIAHAAVTHTFFVRFQEQAEVLDEVARFRLPLDAVRAGGMWRDTLLVTFDLWHCSKEAYEKLPTEVVERRRSASAAWEPLSDSVSAKILREMDNARPSGTMKIRHGSDKVVLKYNSDLACYEEAGGLGGDIRIAPRVVAEKSFSKVATKVLPFRNALLPHSEFMPVAWQDWYAAACQAMVHSTIVGITTSPSSPTPPAPAAAPASSKYALQEAGGDGQVGGGDPLSPASAATLPSLVTHLVYAHYFLEAWHGALERRRGTPPASCVKGGGLNVQDLIGTAANTQDGSAGWVDWLLGMRPAPHDDGGGVPSARPADAGAAAAIADEYDMSTAYGPTETSGAGKTSPPPPILANGAPVTRAAADADADGDVCVLDTIAIPLQLPEYAVPAPAGGDGCSATGASTAPPCVAAVRERERAPPALPAGLAAVLQCDRAGEDGRAPRGIARGDTRATATGSGPAAVTVFGKLAALTSENQPLPAATLPHQCDPATLETFLHREVSSPLVDDAYDAVACHATHPTRHPVLALDPQREVKSPPPRLAFQRAVLRHTRHALAVLAQDDAVASVLRGEAASVETALSVLRSVAAGVPRRWGRLVHNGLLARTTTTASAKKTFWRNERRRALQCVTQREVVAMKIPAPAPGAQQAAGPEAARSNGTTPASTTLSDSGASQDPSAASVPAPAPASASSSTTGTPTSVPADAAPGASTHVDPVRPAGAYVNTAEIGTTTLTKPKGVPPCVPLTFTYPLHTLVEFELLGVGMGKGTLVGDRSGGRGAGGGGDGDDGERGGMGNAHRTSPGNGPTSGNPYTKMNCVTERPWKYCHPCKVHHLDEGWSDDDVDSVIEYIAGYHRGGLAAQVARRQRKAVGSPSRGSSTAGGDSACSTSAYVLPQMRSDGRLDTPVHPSSGLNTVRVAGDGRVAGLLGDAGELLSRKAALKHRRASETIKSAQNHPHPSGSVHLTVFCHGYKGNQYDLRALRNHLALAIPRGVELYMAKSVEGKSDEPIEAQGDHLALELSEYIKTERLRLRKLSFIGHSMGGLVIRCALQSPLLQPYLPLLHTYVSLSTPHLGVSDAATTRVNGALWVLTNLLQSASIKQLKMDTPGLHSLSATDKLGLFNTVILVSSNDDKFVSAQSATLDARTGAAVAGRCARRGRVIDDMHRNMAMHLALCDKVLRFNVRFHPIGRQELSTAVERAVGKSVHVAFIANIDFIHSFVCLFRPYFS